MVALPAVALSENTRLVVTFSGTSSAASASQPGSAKSASRRAVGLGKRLKQLRTLFGAQSYAGIGHRQNQAHPPATQWRCGKMDADASMLSEFQRVAHEIEEDLPHTRRIAYQRIV